MTPERSPDSQPFRSQLNRRLLLRGGAVTGIALPLLVACGSGEEDGAAREAVSAGATLAGTADVPVGGGVVLTEQQVVLTQPTAGTFKAFTAVCTHQQCVVASVNDGAILCGCHGSTFSAEDGSPTDGPAPSPLEEIAITVEGDQILAG